MAKGIVFALIVAMSLFAGGCAGNIAQKNYKVGVINFQQCRPDLTLKEIGLNDIQQRNEALECNKKGMPRVFAGELRNRLVSKLQRDVQLIPLDVPYNHNIQSQIDIARSNNIDLLIGGTLERYIDNGASQRAKKEGILPNTAVLSPVMERPAPFTVVEANISLVKVADREIIGDFKLEEEGDRGADSYTNQLADKIAEKIVDLHY